jgi:peptidoglycan/LPS O-acetylase OafA/YrhL
MTFRRPRTKTMLIASSVLTLLALALMVWSVLVPTPMPVMLAMSVGQGLGTLAFGLYLWAVLIDVLRLRRARRESLPPPLGKESPP